MNERDLSGRLGWIGSPKRIDGEHRAMRTLRQFLRRGGPHAPNLGDAEAKQSQLEVIRQMRDHLDEFFLLSVELLELDRCVDDKAEGVPHVIQPGISRP